MYITDTRKMSLIEEVLRIEDEGTIKALEAALKNARQKNSGNKVKPKISDFLGIITKKEADTMKAAIIETCETVDPNDWK